MPFKHQGNSFRNRKNERYICNEDVLEADHKSLARQKVLKLRGNGVRAFAEHHPDGYSRLFVHEQDAINRGFVSPKQGWESTCKQPRYRNRFDPMRTGSSRIPTSGPTITRSSSTIFPDGSHGRTQSESSTRTQLRMSPKLFMPSVTQFAAIVRSARRALHETCTEGSNPAQLPL